MNSAAQVSTAPEHQLGPVAVEEPDDTGAPGERPEAATAVEVRRNGVLAGAVGVLASAVAIAWLSRATAGSSPWEWAVVGAMALVAVGYLRAALDARTPLLVADAQGVRIRLGRGWRGVPWDAVAEVEHRPRRGMLRDGRLAVAPRDPERFLLALDRGGRRQSRLAQRLYGAPLAVPLGPSTRLVGAGDDLVAQLEALADPSVRVVNRPLRAAAEPAPQLDGGQPDEGWFDQDQPDEDQLDGDQLDQSWYPAPEPWYPEPEAAAPASWHPGPEVEESAEVDTEVDTGTGTDSEVDTDADTGAESAPRVRDPRPWLARMMGTRRRDRSGGGLEGDAVAEEVRLVGEPLDDTAPVGLGIDPAPAYPHPAQVDADPDADAADDRDARDAVPAAREARAPRLSGRVRPIARLGQPVAPIVVDDYQVEPAENPVVGPDIAAARTRLGLTVDQLAERTRIRPHVIESIEVDDFAPCGGDFYARGHLRTLARVLGVDVAPLLSRYDDRYAHAPVDARRVFEAELANAGMRARSPRVRGGPNWSVLIAAFMAVVLCWSVAQLVLDTPPDVRPPTPTLRNGSAGLGNGAATDAEPVPVLVGAVQGGATIEIRDGNGETVFSGDVAYGESRAIDVVPPVQVRSDDGGAVEVTVAGEWRGRMGRLGESATQTYPADG